MSQDQINQLLQQGIAAARGNRPDVARGILQQVLQADPRNEMAWAWLASIARDDRERLIFLKKLWEVNPQNEFALKGLRALGIEPETTPQPQGPQSAVPTLDDTRHTRIQQTADEFLRRYTTSPQDHLNINWARRQRQRYGEGGEKRLQRMIYAGVAVTGLAVVALIVLIISQVAGSLGGDGDEAAFVATAITSPTPLPTYTPTQGGPTPTNFPSNNLAFEATTIPSGLEPGRPIGVATATEIAPPPHTDSEHKVMEAIGYYTIG
ncbi:MAG: hypothetical protein K8S97_05995, partial [Anaerolineae bacterium]|nr:hypothetical protein [Anaerolineae bacterium]